MGKMFEILEENLSNIIDRFEEELPTIYFKSENFK